jgi:DNA-binding NarL/FixJ family response regulator
MKDKIRIVIADDHPIFRQGLRQVVEKDAQIQVIAEAANGESAVTLIQEHQPDIALLDLDMPRLDGFSVVRRLRDLSLATRVIILTMHQDELHFNEALNLGAQGYLIKDSAAADVVQAIHAVAAGQRYISPTLSTFLLNRTQRAAALSAQQPGLGRLTVTERRVLALLAEYKTSKEIAALLGVSTRTIENHRANICVKLELHGTHALVKFALDHKSELA